MRRSSGEHKRCRGFTKFNAADYETWKDIGRIIPDGVNAKLLTNKGPLAKRKPEQLFLKARRGAAQPCLRR